MHKSIMPTKSHLEAMRLFGIWLTDFIPADSSKSNFTHRTKFPLKCTVHSYIQQANPGCSILTSQRFCLIVAFFMKIENKNDGRLIFAQ